VVSPARAFGEKLRAAREQRHLTLETIAHSTKIGLPFLASLERGDCSRWPGGVYSRAYVRSYSQAVGLDVKAVTEEFCDCFPTIAWPEGPPGSIESDHSDPSLPATESRRLSPLDLTQYDLPDEPLRLTLDPMPSPRWGILKSRLAIRLAECAAGVLVAAAVSLVGVDFWMALSAASLTVQARHLP
jgi:transcriptional regulator with XRE-family HTH domain